MVAVVTASGNSFVTATTAAAKISANHEFETKRKDVPEDD